MKKYLIVGSNNFWYTTIECTPSKLEGEVGKVKKEIKQGVYEADEPDTLYAFPLENSAAIEFNI
jgi:hypothetical protein